MTPLEPERLDERLVEFDPTAPATPTVSPRLRAVDIGQFLARDFPPREMMLAPILPTQGLVMLYSKRGVGKTHVALGIAYAVASGGQFLRWKAERPRRVLLLDGEMPGVAMQERLASIVAGAAKEPPSPDYLQIITPDLQDEGFPDLAGEEGQAAVAAHLDGVELVVVDNLSTLFRYGRENESVDLATASQRTVGTAHPSRRQVRGAKGNVTARGRVGYRNRPEKSGRLQPRGRRPVRGSH